MTSLTRLFETLTSILLMVRSAAYGDMTPLRMVEESIQAWYLQINMPDSTLWDTDLDYVDGESCSLRRHDGPQNGRRVDEGKGNSNIFGKLLHLFLLQNLHDNAQYGTNCAHTLIQ